MFYRIIAVLYDIIDVSYKAGNISEHKSKPRRAKPAKVGLSMKNVQASMTASATQSTNESWLSGGSL